MIQDPHKVLGVPENASQDEIKKAYRKKAKEYHPDLHPGDAQAAQKMNEVNEAYDMLMNPEKYAQRKAQQETQRGPYDGYRGYGGYNQQRNTGSQGYSGWDGGFGGFDFGDIFGSFYGGSAGGSAAHAQAEAGDGAEFRRVVDTINQGQYQAAINTLGNIPSAGRNARWYYLSALANYGAGNTILALEHIQKANQMEPSNSEYRRTLQQFQQAGQTYRQNGQGFNMDASSINRLCLGLCAAQLICRFCGM